MLLELDFHRLLGLDLAVLLKVGIGELLLGLLEFHVLLQRSELGEGLFVLDQVAAIQICSKYIDGEDAYTAFELNVILADPPGRRINITSHAKDADLRRDAQKFADFLQKPLLDHAKPN